MLLTDWVTIGTAGNTIDGRVISEQDLIDADETYDRDEYTAVLNSDHALSWYGNFGTVHQTRLGKDKKDRTILQGKIAPNFRLIEMNRNGQRLFFSMELEDDFAGTGKTYLSGLAMTDSPASLGTSMLKFSKENKESSLRIAKPTEVDWQIPTETTFFSRFFSFLKDEPEARQFLQETGDIPDPEQDDAPMDKKQFEEMKGVQTQTLEAINGLTEAIKGFSSQKEEEEETPPAKPTEAAPKEQEENKDFSALKDVQDQTLTAINKLTEAFQSLKQEAPTPRVPAGQGSAEGKQFQVL